MSLEELYQEYAAIDFSEDRLDKLQQLLDASLEANEQNIYQKTVILIASLHENAGELEKAIITLNSALQREINLEPKLLLGITDKLIGLLLRTEDFFELKKVLDYRGDFLEFDKQAKVMQKFYLAVVFEGLGENRQAIDTLLAIEDTLSKSNQVSKYLKLSMLFLREKKIAEAKHYYNYAARFDPERRNPIFDLVSSDILAYEENYTEALARYQDYFLKSKSKTKYLDRYILLMLKLRNYKEAKKYYLEYLPQVDKLVSKYARATFYQAAEKLAIELNDHAECAILREKLNNLKRPPSIEIDQYAGLLELLRQTDIGKPLSLKRDALLDVIRALAPLINAKRLFFVFVSDQGFTVMTHAKGLLLEKTYPYVVLEKTIIDVIMTENSSEIIYSHEALHQLTDYLENSDINDCEYLIAIKTNQDLYPKGFICALLPAEAPFQRSRRLMVAAALLIEQKLLQTKHFAMIFADLKSMTNVVDTLGLGIIEIERGNVFCRNKIAEAMFDCQTGVVSFEQFQAGIISKKKLYLDDFSTKSTLEFAYLSSDKEIHNYRVRLDVNGLVIRGIIEDITIKKQKQASENDFLYRPDVYGNKRLHLFELDYPALQNNHAIMVVVASGAFDKITLHDNSQVQAFGKEIIASARHTAKGYLHGIYTIATNSFAIVLKTTDKRILDRIAGYIRNQAKTTTTIAYPPEIRFGVLLNGKKPEFNLIEKSLLELANYHYLPEEGVFYLRKDHHVETELIHSAAVHLRQTIEAKTVVLEYHPIVNWKKGEAALFEVMFSLTQSFTDHKVLWEAAIRGNLVRQLHQELIRTLAKDLRTLVNRKTRAICLYPLSIKDQGNAELLRIIIQEIKKQRIALKQVWLVLDYDYSNLEFTRKACEIIREEGLTLALRGFITYVNSTDCEWLRNFQLAFISKHELDQIPEYSLDLFHGCFADGYVYEHEGATIRKTELERGKFRFVEGEAYPSSKSIEDLLKNYERN